MKNRKLIAVLLAMLLLCVPMIMSVSAADYAGPPPDQSITREIIIERHEEIVRNYSEEIYQGILDGTYYFAEDGELYDLFGNHIPLSAAAPSTGIDQSGLALERAFNVVIFTLGISLASVGAVVAVKKFGESK